MHPPSMPLDYLHAMSARPAALPSRTAVIEALVRELGAEDCVISALGFISRDLFATSQERRESCFYCMGSMGSVIPLSLGVAFARPEAHVIAFEGDGSLLMNLGTLVTVARYRPANLSIVVFDNRRYESSGGQVSQPEGLRIEDLCTAAGLATQAADSVPSIVNVFREMRKEAGSPVLVAKVALGAPGPRIDDEPGLISRRFAAWLQRRRGEEPQDRRLESRCTPSPRSGQGIPFAVR